MVKDVEGSYSVNIDGKVGQFIVIVPTTPAVPSLIAPTEPAELPATLTSISVWVIIAIMAAGIVGGMGIMFVIRRKRY